MTAPGAASLRIVQAFEPADGGVPQHVLRASRGLLERGHHVTVVGPPDAAPREQLERAGARYVPLPWSASVPAPGPDAQVAKGLVRALRGADVVHAHAQKAGLLVRPVAAARGIPALYTPHSFVYRTQLARPRRGMKVRYHGNRAVEQALGRATAMLVACAKDEADAAVADHIVPRERTTVVEYGVDVDPSIAPDATLTAFKQDGPLLGFVAGLRDQKGLPTLLDALDRLTREGRPVRFAIVGNGPMQAEVEQRLTDTTIHVPFGGRVEPYLNALDAFVLPSLWEGMPIAVLEAMRAGLPIVASAVNGTPEAVVDGTGLLVPPQDAEALADALATIAQDEQLRTRMGRAAQQEADRRFTIPRMIDELEAAYVSCRSAR
jgi:glycosyltransferase involved in cell wall biosynthesis